MPADVGRVEHSVGFGVALEGLDGSVVGIGTVFFDWVGVAFALFELGRGWRWVVVVA